MKRIYGSLELGGARNFHDIFLCDEAPVDGANPSIYFHQRRNEKEEINSRLSFVKGISEILSLMRKSFDNRICRGFIGYYTKVESPCKRYTQMLLFFYFSGHPSSLLRSSNFYIPTLLSFQQTKNIYAVLRRRLT